MYNKIFRENNIDTEKLFVRMLLLRREIDFCTDLTSKRYKARELIMFYRIIYAVLDKINVHLTCFTDSYAIDSRWLLLNGILEKHEVLTDLASDGEILAVKGCLERYRGNKMNVCVMKMLVPSVAGGIVKLRVKLNIKKFSFLKSKSKMPTGRASLMFARFKEV